MDIKSILGYAHFSPFRDNPYLDIQTPEGDITMENTPHDIVGIDNRGNTKYMKAFDKNPYKFEGNVVREIPVHQLGGRELSSYNPYLAADDPEFIDWYRKNTPEGRNRIPFSDKLAYDYYSFYKNGDYLDYKGGHFPDTYKMPNHPTFSDESIYSVPENPGGHWKGEKFIPPKKQVGGMAPNMVSTFPTIPQKTDPGKYRNLPIYHDKEQTEAILNFVNQSSDHLDTTGYLAYKQLLEKNGNPDISLHEGNSRPYYNAFTNTEHLYKKYPQRGQLFAETAHSHQEKYGKSTVLRTIGDWFQHPYLTQAGYDETYDIPGTVENQAHDYIQRKLYEQWVDNRVEINHRPIAQNRKQGGKIMFPKKQLGGLQDLYEFASNWNDSEDEDYAAEAKPPIQEEVSQQEYPQPEDNSDEDLAMQIAMGGDFSSAFLPQEIGGLPMSSSNPYINYMPNMYGTPTKVTAEEHTPIAAATRSNPAKYALNFFQSKGLPKHVAAGIVGNLIQESGNFRQDVIEGRKKGDSGQGFGIAQWHSDRQKGLINWASARSVSPYSLDTQLEYVYHEAQQRGDLQKTLTAQTAEEASRIFAKTYERPRIIDPNRIRYAKNLYNE